MQSLSDGIARAAQGVGRGLKAFAFVGGFSVALSPCANAHVKWFCAYDVAGQPRLLEYVLRGDFAALSVFAISLLVLGCLLEPTSLGEAIARALDRVMRPVRLSANVLLRATCGYFLVSLWVLGGIILTPELKTTSGAISLLQLAMAFLLIWRRTSFLSGLGIVVLYGCGLRYYGFFHLMDYPIFLGVATYLMLTAMSRETVFGVRALDILRCAAGVTLMWASVEKWAYPEWTLPIYVGHPTMSMGFDFEFFMRAAGVIEFTLAFALLWTPLVRRAAALILTGLFVSATLEFGKVDAIGHSVIVAVLLMVAADDVRVPIKLRLGRATFAPTLAYGGALTLVLAAYYGVHALLFGTAVT